jgi:hypothetical protein
MHLGRILNLFYTSVLGQGIAVVMQLVIPPFFLRFYANGIEVYGEWIALSASVTYLETLNYGIQTYANNQTTILYSGGDVEGAKAIQASAFRLLLLVMLVFCRWRAVYAVCAHCIAAEAHPRVPRAMPASRCTCWCCRWG